MQNVDIQSESASVLDHSPNQLNDIEYCSESCTSTSTATTQSSDEYQNYQTQNSELPVSCYNTKKNLEVYKPVIFVNEKDEEEEKEINRKQSMCSKEVSHINSEHSKSSITNGIKPIKNFADPRYELLYKKYYIDEEHLSRPATPTPKHTKKVEFSNLEENVVNSGIETYHEIFKPSTTFSTVNQFVRCNQSEQICDNSNEKPCTKLCENDNQKPCAKSCIKPCDSKYLKTNKPIIHEKKEEKELKNNSEIMDYLDSVQEDHYHLTQYNPQLHYPTMLTPNTVPKDYQSPMLQALITASSKRYCLSPSEHQQQEIVNDEILYDPFRDVIKGMTKAEQDAEKARIISIEAEIENKRRAEEQASRELFLQKQRKQLLHEDGSFLTSSLRVASPLPFAYQTHTNLQIPVSLPEPKEPYFPPPISMEPIRHEPNCYRSKSPMLDALTVASFVPFSSFKQDIISQFDDMPEVSEHLTMSSALVYAPDSAYSHFPIEIVDVNAPPKPLELTLPPIEFSTFEPEILECQMDRQLSAFAKVKSIKPFDPRTDQVDRQLTQKGENINKHSSNNKMNSHEQINKIKIQPHIDQSIEHKKIVKNIEQKQAEDSSQFTHSNIINSSLHKPDQIPTYQRKWYKLPTQNPPRTPEPTLTDTESHSPNKSNPIAVTSSSCTKSSRCSTQNKNPIINQIPIIRTESDNHNTFDFQTTGKNNDCDSVATMIPTKVSHITKSPTLLPYYQQQLAWEEGFAESQMCDPSAGRSPSPCLVRSGCKSPAFGPPPNPMLPHVFRSLDASLNPSGTYLAGQKLEKPAWNLDLNCRPKNKFNNLGHMQQQQQEHKQIQRALINVQSTQSKCITNSQFEAQNIQQMPDFYEQKKSFNASVQSYPPESNHQKLDEMQTAGIQEVDNANITMQRHNQIIKELDFTQTTETTETKKTYENQLDLADTVEDKFTRLMIDSNQTAHSSISTGTPYKYFPTQAKSELQTNKFPFENSKPAALENSKLSRYSFPPESLVQSPGFEVQYNKYQTNQVQEQTTNTRQKETSETNQLFANQLISENACKAQISGINDISNKPRTQQNSIFQPTPFANPVKPNLPSVMFKPNTIESDPTPASTGPSKAAFGATTAPKRGRGVMNKAVGGRTPLCGSCNLQVRCVLL
jgi:hypothetical protein